jgi:hypothetical protein
MNYLHTKFVVLIFNAGGIETHIRSILNNSLDSAPAMTFEMGFNYQDEAGSMPSNSFWIPSSYGDVIHVWSYVSCV